MLQLICQNKNIVFLNYIKIFCALRFNMKHLYYIEIKI